MGRRVAGYVRGTMCFSITKATAYLFHWALGLSCVVLFLEGVEVFVDRNEFAGVATCGAGRRVGWLVGRFVVGAPHRR